jgi:hypothetical protein
LTDTPCDTEPKPDPAPPPPYRAMIEAHVQLVLDGKGDAKVIVRAHRFGETLPLRSIDIAHAGVELRVALEKFAQAFPFKGAS